MRVRFFCLHLYRCTKRVPCCTSGSFFRNFRGSSSRRRASGHVPQIFGGAGFRAVDKAKLDVHLVWVFRFISVFTCIGGQNMSVAGHPLTASQKRAMQPVGHPIGGMAQSSFVNEKTKGDQELTRNG